MLVKLQLLEASDKALEGLSKLISELGNTVNLIESLEKKTQEFREAETEEAKAARKTAAEEILKVGRTSLESREDQIIKLNAAIDLIDSKLATSEDTKNEVQALSPDCSRSRGRNVRPCRQPLRRSSFTTTWSLSSSLLDLDDKSSPCVGRSRMRMGSVTPPARG